MNGTRQQGQPKKDGFSFEEVCHIIDKCKAQGIGEFSLGELKFKFNGEEKNAVGENPHYSSTPVKAVPFPIPEPNHDEINEETLRDEELKEREERLAMLLIEDPLEFERQLSDGELVEDEGSDGSTDEA